MGLAGPDEPRYAWIARAMARTGDWVTPRLYGQPWFEKPILYYWLAAVGFRLNLPAEWAARLPSAFAALVTALAIGWLGRRFYADGEDWASRPGLVAPLIFATSVAAIAFSRAGTPDMLFSACIALTMACAAEMLHRDGAIRSSSVKRGATSRGAKNSADAALISDGEDSAPDHPAMRASGAPRALWLTVLGAFLGAGTLAKGPADVILAGGGLVLWALATRRWREILRLAHPLAIAAFCVVALPWYVICAVRNPDFLRVFILQHNFERYLTPMFQHHQPFWFFGPVFLAALLPWTILLWPALQEGIRLWREKSWHHSAGFFFACWTVFPVLFFSASESKLPSYILPAIAPAALICAVAGIRAFERGRKAAWPIAAGLGVTWIAFAGAGFIFIGRIDWLASNPDAISNGAPQNAYAVPILVGVAALAIAIAGLRGSLRWTIGLGALCATGSVLAANLISLPRVERRFSARPFVQLIQNDAFANRVFAYELPRAWVYGLHFYAGRELPEWSPSDPNPGLVLTTPKGLAEIQKLGRSTGSLGETRGSAPPVMYVPVNAAPRRASEQ
ncbi:MAG TPA: phospholipid carrier-dependent glycosyltransferase [Candidatus Aquilonibacter sp.]|nr:phospholipid carrier-dependent glycosyltransferase [Candidatus Aquilonibacter sp.]